MATIRQILAEKGSDVLSVGRNASVYDAAVLMNEHKIGGLPVLEEGRLAGMFTERDILQRVVAEKRDPARTRVGEVMTHKVTVADIDTTIDEARALMKNKRVRHLPVVDGDRRVLGLVSIGDLNAYMLVDQTRTVDALKDYINGSSATAFLMA